MDWPTFVVEMTKALAWPAVVVAALIAHRKLVPALSSRMNAVRYGDFELAFDAQSVRVAESVSAAPKLEISDASETADPALLALAQRSPRAAIVESWARVERKLRELERMEDGKADAKPIEGIIASLRATARISPDIENSVRGLWLLRNLAVHATERELTPQKAVDFVVLAGAVLWALGTLSTG